MRLSMKGRYAIAATAYLADYYTGGGCVSVFSIAQELGISKIYLEQIFTVLKKSGIVDAVKGAQGGYILTASPDTIRVYDIVYTVEATLFEKPKQTLGSKATAMDNAIDKMVVETMDDALCKALGGVTLAEIAAYAKAGNAEMFYI